MEVTAGLLVAEFLVSVTELVTVEGVPQSIVEGSSHSICCESSVLDIAFVSVEEAVDSDWSLQLYCGLYPIYLNVGEDESLDIFKPLVTLSARSPRVISGLYIILFMP